MKKTVIGVISLYLLFCFVPPIKSQSTQCLITNKDPAKPKPSLIQCYQNNPSSCCNSLADDYISNIYNTLLSKSCARSYPLLESYFCLACNPSQPGATDTTTKTIKICRSYLYSLWGGDLTQPTTTFDNCGMTRVWGSNQGDVILPSTEFSSAADFILNLKPPFFDDYTIEIVDSADEPDCYAFSPLIGIKAIFSFVFFNNSLIVIFESNDE